MNHISQIALDLLVLAQQEHMEAGCFSKSEMTECAICKKLNESEKELRELLAQ